MKMIHKSALLFFCIYLFSVLSSYAQPGSEDVLYLKNGSIIHGMIIEQIPGQTIKIQTRDKNIFVYKVEEVDKIVKETKALGSRKHYAEIGDIKTSPYSGFSAGIEIALGSGIGTYNTGQGIIEVHGLLGYLHKSIFFGGISIGISDWNAGNNNNTSSYNNSYDIYSPINASVDLRLSPIRSRFSPVIIVDAGYSIVNGPLNSNRYYYNYSNGLLFNAGVGGRVNFTARRSLNVSLFYKMQHLQVTRVNTYGNNYNGYNNNYNYQYPPDGKPFNLEAVCLAIGFNF